MSEAAVRTRVRVSEAKHQGHSEAKSQVVERTGVRPQRGPYQGPVRIKVNE